MNIGVHMSLSDLVHCVFLKNISSVVEYLFLQILVFLINSCLVHSCNFNVPVGAGELQGLPILPSWPSSIKRFSIKLGRLSDLHILLKVGNWLTLAFHFLFPVYQHHLATTTIFKVLIHTLSPLHLSNAKILAKASTTSSTCILSQFISDS